MSVHMKTETRATGGDLHRNAGRAQSLIEEDKGTPLMLCFLSPHRNTKQSFSEVSSMFFI